MQDAYGLSNPPAGMLIEKWIEELDREPDNAPRPLTVVLVSVIVTVPVNDASLCVTTHTIWPGPDESAAVPRHVPLTLTGADGAVGDGEAGWVDDIADPPPPLQAPVETSAMRRIARMRTVTVRPPAR